VSVDSDNSIFIAGNTNTSLTGSSLSGTNDAFVARYTSDGTLAVTVDIGEASGATYGRGIAVDASNKVYLGGYTNASFFNNTLKGSQDFFLAKFSF
jgi:hypothetical protein